MILALLLVFAGIGLLFIIFAFQLRRSFRKVRQADSFALRIAGPVDQVRATGILSKAIPLHIKMSDEIDDEQDK
jgi:hypothetical protein